MNGTTTQYGNGKPITISDGNNNLAVGTGEADSILGTNWCVECYPKKNYAIAIYEGNSICQECLEKKQQIKNQMVGTKL